MEQKFTEEELLLIKTLQTKYSDIGIQLVQIKLAIKNAKEYLNELNEQETKLTDEIVEANIAERELASKLSVKYGNGSLDMETGIFVANSEEN